MKKLAEETINLMRCIDCGLDKYILGILKYLDDGILTNQEIASLPDSEVIKRGESLSVHETSVLANRIGKYL